MRKEAFVLVALLALAGLSRAEAEKFTIKVKPYPSKGKSVTVKVTDKLDSTAVVKDAEGKELSNDTESATLREEYTQTTLETKDGKLASFQRDYAVSQNEAGKEKKASSYEGKALTFTLKDKACAVEGKEVKLSEEESAKLS